MLSFRDDKAVYYARRCCQCGVCLSACRTGALSARMVGEQFVIDVDKSRCTGCGLCVKACPAHEVHRVSIPADAVSRARAILLAYAGNAATRRHSSSGGFTRTVIGKSLESGVVDAVYTLFYPRVSTDREGRLAGIAEEAEGRWLVSAPEMDSIPCSLYRPVLWGRNLLDGAPKSGRVFLVGLPCQLKGARSLLRIFRPKLEIFSISLMCRKNKNFDYTRYYTKLAGLSEVGCEKAVTYRGDGWPGMVKVYGNQVQEYEWIYPAKCWQLTACEYCSDCTNAKDSDITAMDPWGIVESKQDNDGLTLAMVWTEKGLKLIESCREALKISHLDADLAVRSFDYPAIDKKRTGVLKLVAGKGRLSTAHLGRIIKARLAERILSRFPHTSKTYAFIMKQRKRLRN